MRHIATLGLVFAVGCTNLELDSAPKIIHARFDPDASVIPMPTDVLRDSTAGRLNLPNDTDKERAKLNASEAEFYEYLETLDGWSTLMSATVEFTGAIDPTSISDGTVQVWHWSAVPERVESARISLSADGKKLTIDPPRTGWQRGDRYVALVRGGSKGLVGLSGEKVECDAAFYFLRQQEALDTPNHEHAFPGDDHDERVSNASRLEGIRQDLTGAFDYFGAHDIPREDVAALWAFTVTTKTELAMDQPSQRIPLPIDLMIDPATGHIDAPIAPWDTPVEAEAKGRLSDLDGASLSGSQLFEFTAPMNAATLTEQNIQLYKISGGSPVLEPATIELLADKTHIVVTPKSGRLPEKTTFALVLGKGIQDANGQTPVLMPIGHFLRAQQPLLVDGHSQIHAIDDRDALKVETSRKELVAALDTIGRDKVLAAWPITTMSMKDHLVDLRKTATTLDIDPNPSNIEKKTPTQAFGDFAIGIGSTLNVSNVYYGTIKTADFLDKKTRAWRSDGSHDVHDIKFTMTMPKSGTGPVPVVIFGHGLITERRFVLALGDALAAKGYAAISVDFPYHGDRTYCAKGGPISVVDPTDGSLASLEPCQSGTTCNDEGKCVDAQGNGNKLAMFPVISMPIASGAMFLEIEHIANTKDHFQQALIDLGALDRSLRLGNWSAVTGRPVDTSKIFYAGQSLGGIMGAIFLGTDPDIHRAVLNVPGANLVPMFDDSTFFSPQLDAFFTRQHVQRDSFEGRRFVTVAKWFMDSVDPQHLGPSMMASNRAVLLQMATLDMIIPNDNTKVLEAVTHAPRRDYIAEHAFLTIPIEPEFLRGSRDLASFLSGELQP